MSSLSYKVPIVLFAYKRRSNFSAIFASLRKIQPQFIYFIADGPKPGEEKECEKTRKTLESYIDWPCKIRRNYSDTNLGLKQRFHTGLEWVFEHEDRVIIIEDDCIPSPSFFTYCEQLLEKYKNDKRIASISGNNFLFDKLNISDSYYFSRYPLIWGWATWKRAWKGYDPELSSWNLNGSNHWLSDYIEDYVPRLYWSLIFNLVKSEKIKTWDYQFTYHCFRKEMLHIIPNCNLVTNVGDDSSATNTKIKSKTIGLRSESIDLPFKHPKYIIRNKLADKITERHSFITPLIASSLVVKSILYRIGRLVNVR